MLMTKSSMDEYCSGVEGNNDQRCLCEEGNFGPKNLADASSPAALLHGYDRLGSTKPAEFLKKWCTMTLDSKGERHTKWHWPNENKQGFLLSSGGDAISGYIDLGPGMLIDRFGHDDTTYFAPFGTPFAMRSLPPSSLNDEYAVYKVKQRLLVKAGPIAPGFEQPGLGTQYIVEMKPEVLFKGETWVRKLTAKEVGMLYR